MWHEGGDRVDDAMAATQHAPGAVAPGPSGLAGLSWLRRLQHDTTRVAPELLDRWGPVVRVEAPVPGVPTVTAVASLEGIRAVLTDREGFGKDNPVYVELGRVLGDGLLTSQGDRWAAQKRTLQPLFTRRRVDGYAAAFDRAALDVAQGWDGAAASVDLDAAMRRLTVRAASETLFGIDATELVGPVLGDVVVLSELVLAEGASLLPRRVPTPRRVRLERLRRRVEQRMQVVLDERERLLGRGGDDLVGLLQDAVDPETGRPLDAQDVREQAAVFLLAGHETTSTALTFALWELARRPELQAAVRDEARRVLGDEPCDADAAAALELSQRVLLETMRLHPPVPVTGRSVAVDTTVDGFAVRRGEAVLTLFGQLHRDPLLWPEPERFDPDRFLPDAVRVRDAYAHLPFGGGPRACIGNHFALLEARIALSRLVRDRALSPVTGQVPVSVGITMTPREPVEVAVTRA